MSVPVLSFLLLVTTISDQKYVAGATGGEGDASSVGIRINSNNVDVGENVRIWCLRRATQQAIRVEQWKFSGRFISDDVRFLKRTVSTFNELFIKSAQISDSGDYTCVTLLGQQTETLHVSAPIMARTVAPFTARVGSNVTLRCDANNYNYIFWYRSSGNVSALDTARTVINGSFLVITDVQMGDNGSYTCEVIANKAVHLKVELIVLPNAPTHQTISDTTIVTYADIKASGTISKSHSPSNSETEPAIMTCTQQPVTETTNGWPSWLLPVCITSGAFIILCLGILVYYLAQRIIQKRIRMQYDCRGRTTEGVSAENPTYSLKTPTSKHWQRKKEEDVRPVGLHFYETIQPSNDTDAGPAVDSAGYAVMHSPMRGVTVGDDTSPTSTTELLLPQTAGYMVMNQITVKTDEKDGVNEIIENNNEGDK
ncbi:uncharacterized protein LOC134176837 isoform X2 [Corticium candelabrum]|uniref:uncharacterized protein LOC134176837 isoform X2 n=1 Tax=Corticium candelabrum TaxID=121492 RepID=UPI002E260F38|nr:uncharacterized protein LOC134176837 isoform X2 [Corticium candelabrum]